MFEKTATTLLDRLGLAIITAIAIRTSITAYSTVVTPFCRLRFASEIESVVFSIVSLDSMSLIFFRGLGCSALPLPHQLPVRWVIKQRRQQRNRSVVADAEVRLDFLSLTE